MKIGDKVELSLTGRIIKISEDIFDFEAVKEGRDKKVEYTIEIDGSQRVVTVGEESLVLRYE